MGALNVPPPLAKRTDQKGPAGPGPLAPGLGQPQRGAWSPLPSPTGRKSPIIPGSPPGVGGGRVLLLFLFFFVVFCTFVRINLIIMRIELIVLC